MTRKVLIGRKTKRPTNIQGQLNKIELSVEDKQL